MPKTSIGSTTTKLSVQETPVIATGGNLSSEQNPRPMDDEYPLEDFLPMFFPPVLASVEVGPGWSTTRAFFESMCAESSMVLHAVMAFSAFQLSASQGGMQFDYKPLYDSASHEIYAELHELQVQPDQQKDFKHILAALLLLTYAGVSYCLGRTALGL
jgi:hypothetical protein